MGKVKDDSHVFLVLQVASTSRGSSGPCPSRGGGSAGNCTTKFVPILGAVRTCPLCGTIDGFRKCSPYERGNLYPRDTRWLFRPPLHQSVPSSPWKRWLSPPRPNLQPSRQGKTWRPPIARQPKDGMPQEAQTSRRMHH